MALRAPPITETFYGTNNKLYKHIYYYALCKKDVKVYLDEGVVEITLYLK